MELAMEPTPTLIIVAGPTAVGKTALSIRLAQHFHTEIISADSRQFFREAEIGTAKPSAEELAAVPHHFINTHSITEAYSAGQYERDALALLSQLFARHKVVILCGGSGMYIDAVCDGFDAMPEVNEGLREKLNTQWEADPEAVLEQLRALDPGYFATVDRQNPHRVIRALEVCLASGKPYSEFRKKSTANRPFQVLKIALELPREELYQRIDLRMEEMIAAGLFEEVERLFPWKHMQALQTVGYKEIFDMMEGHYDREEAIRLLKRNSRRYAKRQLTWLRRNSSYTWFHPGDVEEIVKWIEMKMC
jgi:tRNA dimethylallyltransferase